MANVVYENIVLESKVKDFLDTKLDVSQFYTHDDSMTENAGMKKVVNVYDAVGNVQDLLEGEGNTTEIEVSFTPVEYTASTIQGKFAITDESIMKDETALDTGLAKLSAQIVNNINGKFVAELGKATLTATYPTAGINFDAIVDALALVGEDDTNYNLFINPAQRAQLRKNLKDSLQYVEDFARTGYIGSVSGVNVYTSDLVPADTAYLFNVEAVTVFTKKDIEVEIERIANTRNNIFYGRVVNVVANTDLGKCVKLTKSVA
jgi:hypothetical protein